MACFIAPVAEAIVLGVGKQIAKKHQEKKAKIAVENGQMPAEKAPVVKEQKWYKRLGWLEKLLWGGSALLAFEHVWHGEVVGYLPFLTAAENASDTAQMLMEIGTVGVAMAALCTAVWGAMVLVAHFIEKRADKKVEEKK